MLKNIFLSLLSLLVVGFIVGLILGRHYSPDPTAPAVAVEYMEIHGRWSRDEPNIDSIVVNAVPYKYSWNSASNQVSYEGLSANEIMETSRRHNAWGTDLDDLSKVALMAPVTSVLKMTISTGKPVRLKQWEVIALAAATLGGGGLGFAASYRPNPDTTNDKFIKNMQDIEVWKAVNQDFIRFYELDLKYFRALSKKEKPNLAEYSSADLRLMTMHPEIAARAAFDLRVESTIEEYTKKLTAKHPHK